LDGTPIHHAYGLITPVPTTKVPTTMGPTTIVPTTMGPTTMGPTTKVPTTMGPTTRAPTTRASPASNAHTTTNLQPPSNIQMWINSGFLYIIAKGEPGSTLEMSLNSSPFTNFLQSNAIANANGDFQVTINGYNTPTLFNKILTANASSYYVRTVKDGKTSETIKWKNIFNNCYFNNPGQNDATDMASFASTLTDANNYCIKTLGMSENLLSHSYP